jgi:hypothetical protein
MRVGGVLPLLLAGGCSEAARSGRGTALGGKALHRIRQQK